MLRAETAVETENSDGFRAYVEVVDDPAWAGAQWSSIREAALAAATTAGCTVRFGSDSEETVSPPAQLTLVDATDLKLDPEDEHHFTVKVTLGNENDQPFDLRQVNIQASVGGQDAPPSQDRLTGMMQPTSRTTMDRDFTTDQVLPPSRPSTS